MKRVDIIVAQTLLATICENSCAFPYRFDVDALVNGLAYLPQSERDVIRTYLDGMHEAVMLADTVAADRAKFPMTKE